MNLLSGIFIFKRSYIDLINEFEYCIKWNIVYIINYQIDLCLILFFVLITYEEFKKYLIKSEKTWRHINFLYHFAQKTSLNKF